MICNVTIKGIGIIDEEIKKELNALGYFSLDTAEVTKFDTIRYKGLRITTREDRFTIKNSLHKYFHNNNTGLFNLTECIKAINELCSILKINLWECEITRFEFGINIPVTFKPKLYLNEMYGYKSKSTYEFDSADRRNTIYFKTCDYKIKLYNKTKEAHIKNNILRIEIERLKPAHYLNNMRLVRDIITKESFSRLGEELLQKFNKIQFKSPKHEHLNFNEFLITEYIEKSGIIDGFTNIENQFGKRKKNDVQRKFNSISKPYPTLNKYQTELQENLKTQLNLVLN